MEAIIPVIFAVGVFVFVIRLFGAWMLRINEVINIQEDILAELKEINNNKNLQVK